MKYVLISVTGQLVVGFSIALLLNRKIPAKGLVTTLLMLPMMMSMAIVGLFWKLLYSPSWGIINYLLRLENFVWISNADVAGHSSRLGSVHLSCSRHGRQGLCSFASPHG